VQECPCIRSGVRLLGSERRTVAHLPAGQTFMTWRPARGAIVLHPVRIETALPSILLVEAALHVQYLGFQALDL
jgi:hypothetical protein